MPERQGGGWGRRRQRRRGNEESQESRGRGADGESETENGRGRDLGRLSGSPGTSVKRPLCSRKGSRCGGYKGSPLPQHLTPSCVRERQGEHGEGGHPGLQSQGRGMSWSCLRPALTSPITQVRNRVERMCVLKWRPHAWAIIRNRITLYLSYQSLS